MPNTRRDLLALLGSTAAAAWPGAAWGQQERVRRIGLLLPAVSNDPEWHGRIEAFTQELQRLGWSLDRNIQIEVRWATANRAEIRRHAAELVELAPDVIVAHGTSTVGPMLDATRTLPVVFPIAVDPVAAGFVESLSRPGGNVTGFMTFEYGMAGKWLELLKDIAPAITRVAVLRDAGIPTGIAQFGIIQAVAPSLRVDVTLINARNAEEMEQSLAGASGLIVTASGWATFNRKMIVSMAARHKLPAVYFERSFVADGGLVSYSADFIDQYRRTAGYVHRILNGEKPADLPVQAPTKFELVINLNTARALGLTIPPTLLARADEVIE